MIPSCNRWKRREPFDADDLRRFASRKCILRYARPGLFVKIDRPVCRPLAEPEGSLGIVEEVAEEGGVLFGDGGGGVVLHAPAGGGGPGAEEIAVGGDLVEGRRP
jgi:hypothetical protein